MLDDKNEVDSELSFSSSTNLVSEEPTVSRLNNNNEECETVVTESLRHNITLAMGLLDHIFNLTIVTPLIILHWASSWDIIYLYLLPNRIILSYIITFFICNVILFVSYFIQMRLQRVHDLIAAATQTHNSMFPSTQQHIYYNKQFLMRFVYTYILTWAYVAQWRTYWDFYNYLTQCVRFEYFLGISMITFILYRYVLKCSCKSFTLMVPFRLLPDIRFNEYFIQEKVNFVRYVSNIYTFFVELIKFD